VENLSQEGKLQMTDTTAPVDRKVEIKAQIELADRVLWETRYAYSYNWLRDYTWLKDERARLVRELRLLIEGEQS
jgi:hypothetical protein